MGREPRRIYPTDTVVARRVKSVREHRDMHQDDLAARLDLPRSAISDIERGRRAVTAGELVEICRILRVDIAEFVAEAPLTLMTEKRFE